MDKPTDDSTVTEVKAYLRETWDKGVRCPCCKRWVKRYKYPMNVGLARVVIAAHKITEKLKPEDGYFHLQREFTAMGLNANALCYSRLKWFGMLESHTKDPELKQKNASGLWRLTPKGKAFALNQIQSHEYILVYDNTLQGVSEEKISIVDALDKKFDYSELMAPF